jgi:hypothetical protein
LVLLTEFFSRSASVGSGLPKSEIIHWDASTSPQLKIVADTARQEPCRAHRRVARRAPRIEKKKQPEYPEVVLVRPALRRR